MKYVMWWFCCLLTSSTVAMGSVIKGIEPNDKRITYDESSMSQLRWLFAHMKLDGFATPDDGDTFKFSDYFQSVPDGVPQKSDACFFKDNDKNGFGLITELDETSVICISPIGEGLVEMQAVDKSDITGLLRPCKRAKPTQVKDLQL